MTSQTPAQRKAAQRAREARGLVLVKVGSETYQVPKASVEGIRPVLELNHVDLEDK